MKAPAFADFNYALKSFVGHLEGTHKSSLTIKNYRSDLMTFGEFLEAGIARRKVQLKDLTMADLESYHDYLRELGFKNNSRRRKILTVRKLLGYLKKRKKIGLDAAKRMPAPEKIERVPATISIRDWIGACQSMSKATLLDSRNRVLLWLLGETGCQVSEVGRLRASDVRGGSLAISGKSERLISISKDLQIEIQLLAEAVASKKGEDWLFQGHNKFGSLGVPISARGIELLVKAQAMKMGFQGVTPRTLRHSAVKHWFEEGMSRSDIQKRLGLKTDYSFRIYEPIFKISSNPT